MTPTINCFNRRIESSIPLISIPEYDNISKECDNHLLTFENSGINRLSDANDRMS